MITQIIRKRFFCVTDVCASGKLISQTNKCVVFGARVHIKYLMKAPNYAKIIPARKTCVTDVLCNWEINAKIIKMCVCVIILGPTVQGSLGPSRPETPKKSETCLRGLRPPESLEKVSSGKSLEKVPKRPFRDFFQTLSGGPGPEPRRPFSDLFGVFGPGGPERPPVNGQRVPKCRCSCALFLLAGASAQCC